MSTLSARAPPYTAVSKNRLTRPEVVLLLEPVEGAVTLRPVLLERPMTTILEQCHVGPGKVSVRIWTCDGERAASGQRIFREQVAPPADDVIALN